MAEGDKLEAKAVDSIVSYCPCCGCEFADKATGNEFHDCGECEKTFKVIVK